MQPTSRPTHHALLFQERASFLRAVPLRGKFDSMPVVAVPMAVFMDDTSGNVSKQWNKVCAGHGSVAVVYSAVQHVSAELIFLGLPKALQRRMENIMLFSTVQTRTGMRMCA